MYRQTRFELMALLLLLGGCVVAPQISDGDDACAGRCGSFEGSDTAQVGVALRDAALRDAALPDAVVPDAALPDAALPDAALPDAALVPVQCPTSQVAEREILVEVGGTVFLDGSPSQPAVEGEALSYEWLVIQAPRGWLGAPYEAFGDVGDPAQGGPSDDSSTPTAQLYLDLVGRYTLELRITDSRGIVSPSEQCPAQNARTTVIALDTGAVVVMVSWDTPGDPDQDDASGTDVDLHLLHPFAERWAAAPLDCYYANANPDWGSRGPSGNPNLIIDDTNGAGPEVITIARPEDTDVLGRGYQVGVHYFRAENFGLGTFGPSMARVRIFLDGALALDAQRELLETDHFWYAAEILWGEAGPEARLVDQYTERVPPLNP